MQAYLRQATASQSRLVGPFVDDTDFKTAETGLTVANTDVKISINGAAGANKNSGGGTHRNNGMYSLTFDATDTATCGELKLSIAISGALLVVQSFWVLEEAIYDALFAASAAAFDGNQRVDVGRVAGTSQTARDIGASVLLSVGTSTGQVNLSSGKVPATVASGDIATDAVSAAAVSAAAVTKIQNGLSTAASHPANFSSLSIDASGRVDVIKINGTSQTARDLGASVLVSVGTGAGQINVSGGVVPASVSGDVGGNVNGKVLGGGGGVISGTGVRAVNSAGNVIAEKANQLSDQVWTDARAAMLDAAVTSRLASADYTAPDNAGVAAVVALAAKLDSMVEDGGGGVYRFLQAAVVKVGNVLGLTSADLATRVDALQAATDAVRAKTDNLPASPASTGDVPTTSAITAAVFGYVTEVGETFLGAVRIIRAAAAGLVNVSGFIYSFRDRANAKNRIVSTTDADGQRTAVTTDAT